MNKRLLTFLIAGAAGWSATIVDVSGPNNSSLTTTELSNNLAVGFSLASSYSNLSVSATLVSFGGSGDWNLSAYLTNSIGPGTTLANEVASSSSVITLSGGPVSPPFGLTTQTVFSGLTLGPGSYYLILSGTFNTTTAWWASSTTGNGVISTFGGASVIASGLLAGAPDSYLPASTFSSAGVGDGFWFNVSGDVVETVPEPSTAIFAVSGIVLLGSLRLAQLYCRSTGIPNV